MKVEIPQGWRVLPVGTIIKKGDMFVNAEGKWIKSSDYGRKVIKNYPCVTDYEEMAGIYIRKFSKKVDKE